MTAFRARVVAMKNEPVDHGAIIAQALTQLGGRVTIDRYAPIPTGRLNRHRLNDIKKMIEKRGDDEIVIFCPGLREYFLEGADLSVQFSSYINFEPSSYSTLIVPHPWNLAAPDPSIELLWKAKPDFVIGFLGTAYASSRAGRAMAMMPAIVRNWVLRGGLVRSADRVAFAEGLGLPIRYAMTFPRARALEIVRRDAGPAARIVDTHGFDFTADARANFSDHMVGSTYVLCPRGCENYSFRVYEALRFGRVPVIIDTGMHLPHLSKLKELCVFVSYNDINKTVDMIKRDYERNSESDFIRRQQKSIKYSKTLMSEHWLAHDIEAKLIDLALIRGERTRAGE